MTQMSSDHSCHFVVTKPIQYTLLIHTYTIMPHFNSPCGSPGLPPRLRVPPTPPYIHRKLQLGYDKQGLTLFPDEGDGLRVRWGATVGIEKGDPKDRPERYVSIAGVLGIVRLWDCESDSWWN